MNHKGHITHWKGIPLRSLSRDELIDALQYYSARYAEERDRTSDQLNAGGRAIVETWG